MRWTVFIWCRMLLTGLPQLGDKAAYLKQEMQDKLIEHKNYIRKNGIDMPEIREWKWQD